MKIKCFLKQASGKKNFKYLSVLAMILMLAGCVDNTIDESFDYNLPEDITVLEVTPASGVAKKTFFTWQIDFSSPLDRRVEVFLELWSPNIENQWDWLLIPMEEEEVEGVATRYVVSKALADHALDYKYRYSVRAIETGDIVYMSGVFYGPATIIDTNDALGPQVLRTFPVNNSIGVEPSQEVVFVFDEVIDPATVNPANITISNSNIIESTQAYQNRIRVKFVDEFDQVYDFSHEASKYVITIDGVQDLNGNTMSEPFDFTFHVKGPLLQTWAIESRKYSGNCITVKDIKKRFADPQTWNPVVELIDCVAVDTSFSQRWFFEKPPGSSGAGLIRWSANYDYCLSKRSASDPVIRLCDSGKSEQNFWLEAREGHHLIHSNHGGCVASGVVDAGDKNKVESSLCTGGLSRNHWKIEAREQQELSPAFMIGKFDIRFADIQYNNPATGSSLSTEETRDLVQYLYSTNAVNMLEVYEEFGLQGTQNKSSNYETANPYYPRYTGNAITLPRVRTAVIDGVEVANPEGYANTKEGYDIVNGQVKWFQQEVVSQWYSDVTHGQAAADEVCAVKFLDAAQEDYELQTFATKTAAELAGYTVTHQYKCGTCSTLKDLAVYMGIPDQTSPVRLCAKRGRANWDNLDSVKQCLQESVGFTSMCAESWAYNSLHTGSECRSTCMKAYGNSALFWPRAKAFFTMVIMEKFNACPAEVETSDPVLREQMKNSGCPLANEETGKLNACLWCDERTSGPGFKFSAARTRRGSGLQSAIPRPNDKLFYEADHTKYFE